MSERSRIKELIEKGKEQGYLTYTEVNDYLPEDITEPDQVEDIVRMITDMGITVTDVVPDMDHLLLNESASSNDDDSSAEEAAAALVAVENEGGRTTDTVRMYMKEMGLVELLTREGEIDLAKRIEDGARDMMLSMVYFPGLIEQVIQDFSAALEQGKIHDIVIGFYEKNEPKADQQDQKTTAPTESSNEQQRASQKKQSQSSNNTDADEDSDIDENESDTEEDNPEDNQINIELVREKFDALKKSYTAAKKSINKQGYTDAKTKAALKKTGICFAEFRLNSKYFEPLVTKIRSADEEIRKQERIFFLKKFVHSLIIFKSINYFTKLKK